MTDLAMHATPPQVGIDITYSLLSSLVAEAEMQEVVAIAIETKIYTMEAPETNGFFFCIPTQEGLDTLFKKLGIRGAA
jgi:chemotaxis protein CheY-P-specific phosphatase CheC